MSEAVRETVFASGKIRVETSAPVATVIIDRPRAKNALDNEAAHGLAAALRAVEADETVCCAVLTGAGGAFCAGADLKELGGGQDYFPWAGSPEGPLHKPLAKPLIGAVEGHACAGGLGVALYCDLRIVDETASFAVFSRRWGVPMSDGTTVRLPRLIGTGRALEMLLTARAVGADEAVVIGLATTKVARGTTRSEAEALARRIAAFPQIAMRADRASAWRALDLDEAAAIRAEMEGSLEARRLEAQAGAARFAGGAGRHGKVE